MSDDLVRAEAWTRRLRELDDDNHDLRRRLRQLTDAARNVANFAGHPPIWTLLNAEEQGHVTVLAHVLVVNDVCRESMRRPGGDT